MYLTILVFHDRCYRSHAMTGKTYKEAACIDRRLKKLNYKFLIKINFISQYSFYFILLFNIDEKCSCKCFFSNLMIHVH